MPATVRYGDGDETACRRGAGRAAVQHAVRFEPQDVVGAAPRRATLLDVSATGLCLLCDAVCAPGERLVVHLPYRAAGSMARDEQDVSTVVCAVRTCRVRSDGLFRVGVELIDALWELGTRPTLARSANGITGWIGSFLWGRRSARATRAVRRSERRGADGRATICVIGDHDRDSGPAETVGVVDLSDVGIAILRRTPLAVADQFVARVPREGAAPVTRLCRVTGVSSIARQYRIGAEFVPAPAGFGSGWLGKLLDWVA